MKRVIMVIGAGSAAITALARRTAEQYREIRDLASGGPSIDVCPECMRVYDPKPFGGCGHCQRAPKPAPPSRENDLSLAMRIRSILGARNDNSRTVVDLIDELCEGLDRHRPPAGWLVLPEDFFTHAGDFEEAIELAISCTGDPEGYWSHQLDTIRLARIAAGNGPDGWGGADLEVTPSGPVRDRQLDRMNGPKFTARENRVPCGLCNGVGIVDIGFGQSDTCGGCKGTGRVET